MASEPVRQRHDGFTTKKRRRFLVQVAKSGCIRDGCRAAGVSKTTIERWRRKDPEFASRLAAALDRAAAVIEVLAWQRAVTGIEEPVFAYGKQVGMRIKRSDAIFRMLMIASDPAKYGRMGKVAQQAQGKGHGIVAGPGAAGSGKRRPMRGDALRRKLEEKLSEINRRLGGNG